MPLITLPDHRALPPAEEPATVLGLMLIVSVQCACGAALALLNAQPAICEVCGAMLSIDAVTWRKDALTPQIALSASPSRAKALVS